MPSIESVLGMSTATAGRPMTISDVLPPPEPTSRLRAFGAGFGSGSLSLIRGARQLVTGITKEDTIRQAELDALLQDPDVSSAVRAGEFLGTLFEPVSLALPVGKVLQVGRLGTKVLLGAGLGALSGGLGEVRPGESRLEKGALGAAGGAVLTPALSQAFRSLSKLKGVMRATPTPSGPVPSLPDFKPVLPAPIESPVLPPALEVPPAFPRKVEQALGISLPEKAQLEGFAGNINLSKLNTPDDVEQTIRSLSTELTNKAVPMDALREMALRESMTPESAVRDLGNLELSSKTLASSILLKKTAEEVHVKAKLLAAKPEPLTDEELTQFMIDFGKQGSVQSVVSNLRAELGRSMRVLREPARLFDLQELGRLSDQQGGRDGIERLIQQVAALETPEQVQGFSGQVRKPGLSEKTFHVFLNWILSGPQTQFFNLASNLGVSALRFPERLVATTIEKGERALRPGLGGIPSTFHGDLESARGLIQAIPEGLRAAGTTFLSNVQPIAGKLEGLRSESPLTSKFGKALALHDIPLRSLSSSDVFSQTLNLRASLRKQAVDQAIAGNLKGKEADDFIQDFLNHTPDGALRKGIEEAQNLTFTGKAGTITGPVIQILREHPLLRFIVPFVRTLGKVTEFGLQRTPLGLTFQSTRKALTGSSPSDRAEAVSRMVIGSGIMASFVSLADQGLLHGTGSRDPRIQQGQRGAGNLPVSIRIGGRDLEVSRLDPLATFVGIAGDLSELKKHYPEQTWKESVLDLTKIVSRNLLNNNFLNSLSGASLAITDPARHGESYIRKFESSLIPAFVRQARQIEDPFLREARTFHDVLMNGIPFQSEKLLPKRDLFGEAIRRETLGGFSGMQVSTPSTDPVRKIVADLRVSVPLLKRKVSGITLTPREFDLYSAYAGQLAHEDLGRIMTKPIWDRKTEDQRREIIRKVFLKSRDTARKRLRSMDPQRFRSIRADDPIAEVLGKENE